MTKNIDISNTDLIAICVFATKTLGDDIFFNDNDEVYEACKVIHSEYIKSDYENLNDFLYFEEKERLTKLIKEML